MLDNNVLVESLIAESDALPEGGGGESLPSCEVGFLGGDCPHCKVRLLMFPARSTDQPVTVKFCPECANYYHRIGNSEAWELIGDKSFYDR